MFPIKPLQTRIASGLYQRHQVDIFSSGKPVPLLAETVRLDVDGDLPQRVASGTYYPNGVLEANYEITNWIAFPMVEKKAGEEWEGPIVQRWPRFDALIPHRTVNIRVPPGSIGVIGPEMTITFSGDYPTVTRTLQWESPFFHKVEFEFDTEIEASRVTRINTCAHQIRPSNLPCEWLNIDKVYERAGIEVRHSPNTSSVPLLGPMGEYLPDAPWSDQELHDAMRVYWSRYTPRAQWALWFLFARRYDKPQFGGMMFDNSNRNPSDRFQRQGAAVFSAHLEANLPPGEPQPDQWMARHRFFAAVHEIGHCFNLSHSDEKLKGDPWLLTIYSGKDVLSFMNPPSNYPGGADNFYSQFPFQFDNQEIQFLRHAPEEFVQMGAALASKDHGFSNARFSPQPTLALDVAVNRTRPVFEFLEPVKLDLQLTNISHEPQVVDPATFVGAHNLTLFIQRRDGVVHKLRPYVRLCSFGGVKLLRPGQSLKASLFASAGVDGWYLADPGSYTVHAAISRAGEEIQAEPLNLRIASPQSWEEDYLAQNLFTDEVGRALALGGTYAMTGAIEALEEAADRFKQRAIARHAQLALGLPRMENRRMLSLPEGRSGMSSVSADGGCFEMIKAKPEEARRLLNAALLDQPEMAAQTFGQTAFKNHVELFANWLEHNGDRAAAKKARAKANLSDTESDEKCATS